MICKHCGTQNPDNTRICKQCGMPLEESTAQNPVKQEESKNKTSKNVMKKINFLVSWLATRRQFPIFIRISNALWYLE